MPSLLPPEQLQAGNAINSAAIQIGTVAGPALGGILVATAGPVPGFAVDAATFGVSALSLWLMRPAANEARAASPAGGPLSPGTGADGPVQAPDGVTGAGADGTQELDAAAAAELPSVWRLWAGSRFLQVLGVISVLANLTFAGTFEVALPALAHARFGADGYGTLMACLGAGSVAGTLLATRPLGRARPMVVASLAFTASGLTVIALPYLGGLPGGSAAALLFGAGIGFGDVIVITLVQQWAPPALLGRVMSLVMLASIGTFPVSVAIAGVAVRALGPVPFFPVAGAVLALVPVIALTSRETRNFRPGPAPPETAR
jgi:predicted MFS family arabinose efflux permease